MLNDQFTLYSTIIFVATLPDGAGEPGINYASGLAGCSYFKHPPRAHIVQTFAMVHSYSSSQMSTHMATSFGGTTFSAGCNTLTFPVSSLCTASLAAQFCWQGQLLSFHKLFLFPLNWVDKFWHHGVLLSLPKFEDAGKK